MGQRIAAAEAQGDRAAAGRWLATGMVVLGTVATFLVLVAVMISSQLPAIFRDIPASEARRFSGAFSLAAVGTGLVIVNNGLFVYARSVQRPAFLNGVLLVSGLFNFLVTLIALRAGAGLYAIAYGVLARSALQTVASLVFLTRELAAGLAPHFRFDHSIFREAARLMPATLAGGLAFAALNQTELLILNLAVGAVAAASFLAIRRAAELVRALTDTLAVSSYASFAHLVSSPERGQAGKVLDELSDLRLGATTVLLAPYLAVNSSFIAVWLKGEVLPNGTLTILVAAQSLVVGGGFLVNYLFRASGAVAEGSLLVAGEAILRIAAMYILCREFGPVGIPIGALATSIPAWIYTGRRLRTRIGSLQSGGAPRLRAFATRSAILGGAALLGTLVIFPSWSYVLGTAVVVAGIALAAEPSLGTIRARLMPKVGVSR
ncbi:MAG: hypothetical protein C4320_04095 [Armatimonadota bacterium]